VVSSRAALVAAGIDALLGPFEVLLWTQAALRIAHGLNACADRLVHAGSLPIPL